MTSIKKTVLSIKGKTGRSYFSFTLCFLFLNTYFLLLNTKIACAQSLSLSIWPPLLEVMIQPGRSITQVYKLTNASDHALQVTPNIFPFKPQGENGEIKIKFPASKPKDGRRKLEEDKGKSFFSFGSGEKFNQPFYLPMGQTREIVLKISIPKNTPELDYYYTLLFSTSTPAKETNSSGSLTQIGSNILLTVSQTGEPTFLGRILEFSTPKIIDSFSPMSFSLCLENWGKAFWKPFGKIKITGMLKQKDEIELLPQNVLAESSRKLDIPKIKPKLPLGPFKASLEFSLNEEGDQKLSAETTFWYLPYKATVVIVIFLVIGFFIRRIKSVKLKAKSGGL